MELADNRVRVRKGKGQRRRGWVNRDDAGSLDTDAPLPGGSCYVKPTLPNTVLRLLFSYK